MNGRRRMLQGIAMLLCLSSMAITVPAFAEPHLAVQKGLKCGLCHISPSGGGMRTNYGNIFAQQELPANSLLKPGEAPKFWTGKVFKYLAVGGDVRGGRRAHLAAEGLAGDGQPGATARGVLGASWF